MSGLDEDVKRMIEAMATAGAPPLWSLPIEEARRGLLEMSRGLAPAAPEVEASDELISAPGRSIAVRLYKPLGGEPDSVALLIHGGGWALGSIESHDALARQLCVGADTAIVSVDYRLAPEHPFPAGFEDCREALAWCAARWPERRALSVVGDSAGGNLAAAVAIHARDAGGPQIDCQILIYPCVDIDPQADFPSRRTMGPKNYVLGSKDIEWLCGMYLPDARLYADPRVSPLRAASLAGLPPALVITAGFDPLRDEGQAYHQRLIWEGVDSTCRCFAGTVHGFVTFAGALASGVEATAMIAEFLRAIKNRN